MGFRFLISKSKLFFLKKEHSHLDQELKIHSSNNKNYKSSQELSPQETSNFINTSKKNSKRIPKKKDSKMDSKKDFNKKTFSSTIFPTIFPTDKMHLEIKTWIGFKNCWYFLNCSILWFRFFFFTLRVYTLFIQVSYLLHFENQTSTPK